MPIAKNQGVIIGVAAANRDEQTWGPDAGEWRPERWLDLDSAAGEEEEGGASAVEASRKDFTRVKQDRDVKLPGVYSGMYVAPPPLFYLFPPHAMMTNGGCSSFFVFRFRRMTFSGGSRACMCVHPVSDVASRPRSDPRHLTQRIQVLASRAQCVMRFPLKKMPHPALIHSYLPSSEVVLATMIDRFEFAPTGKEIVWHMTNIQTPYVKGREKETPHLPLIVSIAE